MFKNLFTISLLVTSLFLTGCSSDKSDVVKENLHENAMSSHTGKIDTTKEGIQTEKEVLATFEADLKVLLESEE